jgi:hypothetical protein
MAGLPQGRAYGVFAGNIPFQPGDFYLESVQDGITANAGGGQQAAYQITTQTARVTVVATAGDSVQLPSATPGIELLLINHGANSMQVFGNFISGVDTIDDQAFGTGVSQMANSMVIYTCPVNGKWYSEGLSSGFSTSLGLQTFSYSTIAANATVTQAAGTPIAAMLTNMTSGAAGAATLPVSQPGLELTVHNISAFTVTVFPNAGGTGSEKINALTANSGIAMATNTSTVFTCVVAGQWYTVPRVPS